MFNFSPKVDFTFDPASGEEPLVVDFAPVLEDVAASYLWTFGDGTTSTEHAPSHIYYAAGTFSVELAVEFANGRTTSTTKADCIVVSAGPMFRESDGIYWVDRARGNVLRGTRDGSGTPQTIVDDFSLSIGAISVGITDVYIAASHRVWRAPLDGSTGVRGVASYGTTVADVAVDTTRNEVYWVVVPTELGYWREEAGGIYRADLDGSNVTLYQSYSVGSQRVAWELALDPFAGAVYWFDSIRSYVEPRGGARLLPPVFDFEIHGSPYSGWPVMTVYPISSGTELAASVGLGHAAQYLYWTQDDVGEIMRCKVDGTEVAEILLHLPHPTGIAVDVSKNALYWSDDEGVHRANLDGTNARLLYDVTADTISLGP